MESKKVFYVITLALFSSAVIGSIANSIINYESIEQIFIKLGYPVYLIHILGVAQIVGLFLLITNKGGLFLEWVYAGFFFNYTLGAIAHLAIKDGNGASAVVCLILLWVTYYQSKKVKSLKKVVKTPCMYKKTAQI